MSSHMLEKQMRVRFLNISKNNFSKIKKIPLSERGIFLLLLVCHSCGDRNIYFLTHFLLHSYFILTSHPHTRRVFSTKQKYSFFFLVSERDFPKDKDSCLTGTKKDNSKILTFFLPDNGYTRTRKIFLHLYILTL